VKEAASLFGHITLAGKYRPRFRTHFALSLSPTPSLFFVSAERARTRAVGPTRGS